MGNGWTLLQWAGDASTRLSLTYTYTLPGLAGELVRLEPPVRPPEAWLVLGVSLGVSVSPGHNFQARERICRKYGRTCITSLIMFLQLSLYEGRRPSLLWILPWQLKLDRYWTKGQESPKLFQQYLIYKDGISYYDIYETQHPQPLFQGFCNTDCHRHIRLGRRGRLALFVRVLA